MQKDKVRVFALARELNIETKDLLEYCQQAGIQVKNQLSTLDPDQRDLIEQMVKRGGPAGVALATSPKGGLSAPLPEVTKSVPVLHSRPVRREGESVRPAAPPLAPLPAPAAKAPEVPKPVEPIRPPTEPPLKPTIPPVEKAVPPLPAAKAPETPLTPPTVKPPMEMPTPRTPPSLPPQSIRPVEPKIEANKIEAKPPAPPPAPSVPPPQPPEPPPITPSKVPDLDAGKPPTGPKPPAQRKPRELRPLVHRATPPPPLKQISIKETKKPEIKAQKPIAKLTTEHLQQKSPIRPEDLLKPSAAAETVAPVFEGGDEEEGEAAKGGKGRPKGVAGRQKRQEARNERAKLRKRRESEVQVVGGRAVAVEEETPARSATRLKKLKQKQKTQPRKGKVPLEVPITVRSLSEAIGMRSVELLFKLRDHGLPPATNINTVLEANLAEEIALEAGCELEIKRPLDAEEQLLADLNQPDDSADLILRAPIVTIMGHVDHGKTSLLDKIRQSNVVATEAGGITQVIRAWRVEHGGRPITFLDTPGHEAFTKMRARGAHVTDIAVIVVAADDGVMPQTQEAIDHAKAAGVSLVVAINKVDLPSANLNKTRRQLYDLNILPDNMGGDTPFVETSAATGKGIDELLDQLSVVAELKELKANPHKAGSGTCLEAMLSEGEGVRATLLVRNGTLRRGDIILCGATYGRVRQLYDDLGRPIQEAGPSVPVRITGLDEVPDADDPFVVVPDLATAREIAEKRKAKRLESSLVKRSPLSLEKLTEAKIAELKVILKADFRGSIEAIRKELEKLHHEEVRVRVLEAAIGGITENDVWLALTSPEDTMIIGFNVVPDDRARALAEEKGVPIRQYDIIYNLTNDIRAALEGKLKPREEVVQLGRAVVRDTFKISRVGTIAGCYVTQGIIRRNAKIRVIREGVVVYPPADRSAGLESLKRYKDDVAEVREGFECGLKIAGYDDIKVNDVIEAYRVEQVQRTLE